MAIVDIDALYARMTQEERVAQLCGGFLNGFFDQNNRLDEARCRAELPHGIGHFSQYTFNLPMRPDVIRDMVDQMQRWLLANTPSGIPALFHEELLTGIDAFGATIYPQQIGLACSFNTELIKRKTCYSANSFRKIGGGLALSPMVDVVRTPSFNRLEESNGEDGFLSSEMAAAFVDGLQHEGNLRSGIAACTKHFLGYGGGGNAPDKELMEDILRPHEIAIRKAHSRVLMTGYHKFRGVDAVANPFLQKTLLREYLGFDGLTVSDYGSIEQLPYDSPVEKAAAAMNAGNDVDFPNGACYKHLPKALARGLVSPERFEEAVKHVLALKAELGILDKNAKFVTPGPIDLDSPEERSLAYTLACQSVVLLQNNGILPLKQPAKIALTGPNANSMWAMLGDYTFPSMRYFWTNDQFEKGLAPHIICLKEGLEAKLPPGFALTYSRGCDWTERIETTIEKGGDSRAEALQTKERRIESNDYTDCADALRIAADSDIIIAAVGENVLLSGENRDRPSLRLPGAQEAFVQDLLATGKPVILIVFGGRAQVISSIAEHCAAVIQAWYPGEEGGNALADILYGTISPSGKLCVSYPAEEIRTRICYTDGLADDRRIAWPFGYGLTYTSFDYREFSFDETAPTNGTIDVSCLVTNTGAVAADEVVQLYAAPLRPTPPSKQLQLVGFQRIPLVPGETKRVSFRLPTDLLAEYSDGHLRVFPGRYRLRIGPSSANLPLEGILTLTESS